MVFRDPRSQTLVRTDAFERFKQLHAALESGRGFFEQKPPLRLAAVTLLTTDGEPAALVEALREKDGELSGALGWFSEVAPSVRLLIAGLLVKYGDEAAAFVEEVGRVQAMMRARSLRRGRTYEFLATLVLRRIRAGEAIREADIDRFAAVYEEMKRHHWWLTGPEDFPACAMLVGQPGDPRSIGESIEAIYQALRTDAGLRTGDPLQTAANVLYLTGLKPVEIATRVKQLCAALKDGGQSVWQREYDEVAALCFLALPVELVVRTALEYRDRLQAELSWLGGPMAFTLGTGLAFVQLASRDETAANIGDIKALIDMQAIVSAQQAAAIAASA
ncbi:MAG: DUF4003 family protein [Nannocystaceae bacterium]|nr:DUF4003 domain-containing protein [bacterium]